MLNHAGLLHRRLTLASACAWGLVAVSWHNVDAPAGEPPEAAPEIRPFQIAVEDAVLEDLQARLARTRWPQQIEGSQWEYGVPLDYMRQLVAYWQSTYNWREQERRLNQLPQFTTTIDGLEIHFVHVRSREPNALPLLIVHGWPGSFYEFYKIIGPLTDPLAHGGRAEDAFHVVCPSLPGFAFSSKPNERGWTSQRMAEVCGKLMARLGYERYGAQGGDWGSGIVRWLASADGGHCVGAHSNFPPAAQPAEDPMRDVTPEELERFQNRRRELADHFAYAAIQGTRPLTLAYGLNDSPAALAAWIVDKFWAWSDHGGDLERSFTKDELLTNVMLYWVTESMPSATRIYYESSHNLPRPSSMTPFQGGGLPAPLGFALFPKEINVPPRAWVERNVGPAMIHWTEMPHGGHFAALEVPDLLVEDVRAFFRKLRAEDARAF
jgi:pimeloyl-ACP methyl ester carboxylesterase